MVNKKLEKDTRPVKCFICGKKMFYSGHPKWEPEYRIVDDVGRYAHVDCVIRNKKKRRRKAYGKQKTS